MGRFCGTTAPPPFTTSSGNVMTVRFVSDSSGRGRGFLLNWSAVDTVVTTPAPTTAPPTGEGETGIQSHFVLPVCHVRRVLYPVCVP